MPGRFAIGDLVTVHVHVHAEYDENDVRVVEREQCSPAVQGQIVGMRRLYAGRYKRGTRPSYSPWGDDGGDGPEFKASGHETVWLVSTGMFNKPIMVRDEDAVPVAWSVHVASHDLVNRLRSRLRRGKKVLTELVTLFAWEAPLLASKQPEWSPEHRATQRRIMTSMPRDERGRWGKRGE